jgi:2,3,4,5-tetrahydropyridine-2-carboxylate N-succinyltransferase
LTNSAIPAHAWGIALITRQAESAGSGVVLDAWFPEVRVGERPESAREFEQTAEFLWDIAKNDTTAEARGVVRDVQFISGDLASAPKNAQDVYLRLHALSMRLIRPNTVNLEGIFAMLENVVWTNYGPCLPQNFEKTRLQLMKNAHLNAGVNVYAIDKIPRMVDYVVPEGVRIADADRVRLGAHLASGTTVMHAGFVNYNAGTIGASMVEGRISQGVVVDDGSDIGGGASIMGTLSGGGKHIISIGKRSLLGANAGIGISLGDDCIVEAGLYITAGTKVLLRGEIHKGRELSGQNGLLFRRNSQTGAIEAIVRDKLPGIELNSVLHTN